MLRPLLALFLAPCLLTAAQEAEPESSPSRARVLPAGSTLIGLSQGAKTASLYDAGDLELRARIQFEVTPHEVACSEDGREAYVMLYGDGARVGREVAVIDLESASLDRVIELGPFGRPHGVVELDGTLWITAESSRALIALDPDADAVTRAIGHGGSGGHMVGLDRARRRAYVPNIASSDLSVLHLDDVIGSPASIGRIEVPDQPEGLAVSPDGREVWLGHKLGGLVSVVDTGTSEVVATIDAGSFPYRLTFTPDGQRVLWTQPDRQQLVVADAATREMTQRIAVEGGPTGVVVTEDDWAYVSAFSGSAAIVDLRAGVVVARVETGPSADGICLAVPREIPERPPVARPGWLGVNGTDGEGGGVTLTGIGPGAPAATAGLAVGDRLLSLDGVALSGMADLVRRLRERAPGDRVRFELERGGAALELEVVLGERTGG